MQATTVMADTKHNKYRAKVCAECGKIETNHWKRHWQRQHPGLQIREKDLDEALAHLKSENW